MGLESYRLTSLSFHVDRPFHSWDTAFSKYDLENQGSRSLVRSQFKVAMWVLHNIDSHPFHSMTISPPISEIQHFQNLTLKMKGQSQMICTTTGLDISIELWMAWIHSAVSKIWVLQDLAQVLPDLTVFGPWANQYGVNGQIITTAHNYRSRQVHDTLNGAHAFSGFRDMRPTKSGPNLWQIWQVYGPWGSSYGENGQMTMAVHN